MTTQQDFDTLRVLAVDCVWAVQALVAHRDRPWPPTRRHADYDAWQHRNLQRDIEAVSLRLTRAFTSCVTSARAIRYDFKPEIIDPIRLAVAGRPVTFGQDVYTTAHEAAFKVCEGMDDLRRDAHAEAEQDADRYDFAFVDAALRMLRDVPNVQALEAGIEHEYQLVVEGLATSAAKKDDTSQVLAWTPPLWPSKAAKACGLPDKRVLLSDHRITHEQVNPPKGRKYRFDLDAILECYGEDAADAIDDLSD